MPAWPVEQIIEANSTTYEQLLASIITIAAAPGPAYSYENTFVAATEAGEFYLDSVGLLQEYRGRGIVTVFLAMTIILSYRT